jgi:hypothetical protein
MMIYRLAVEDMEPDHWVAFALDLPGCFCTAQTAAEAIALAPLKIADYFDWLAGHDPSLPVITRRPEVTVVEQFHSLYSPGDPDYLVNAFFDDDRRPLTYWEVAGTLRLLNWTRRDLLMAIRSVTASQLAGPVGDLLKHIGGAENWYFDRFDLGLDPDRLPSDPLMLVETVRANSRARLPQLIGDTTIREKQDERWSARKIIRRTLWHEQDHTRQIKQLLA